MPEPYAFHLACNDPDTGRYQGFVEAIEVYQGQHLLLSLERYGDPLVCAIEPGGILALGRLRLPCDGYGSHVGNMCWDAFHVQPDALEEVLRLLATTGWHVSQAHADGLRLWDAAGAPMLPPRETGARGGAV